MTIAKAQNLLVVGAGIFGLSCAYFAARAGIKVRVLEAAPKIGVGASGGIIGAMAPHTPDNWNPKKQFQYQALSTAAEFWAEVDELSGLSSGYGRVGRVQPLSSQKERSRAEARIKDARQNWPNGFEWAVLDESPYLSATHAPFGVVADTLSARIYPALAIQSLARACENLGVVFSFDHPVTDLHDHGVAGPWGRADAHAVIHAAGVEGFRLLGAHLGQTIGLGVKGQAALFDLDLGRGARPVTYADGLYIIAHENGHTAVGATSENEWSDPSATDHLLDEVVARAIAICPDLANAKLVEKWASLRPKAQKRDPMLGPLPNLPGHFVASGAFKIGFGIAHKVGADMAQLIMGNTVEIPQSFSVEHHMGTRA